MTDKKEIIEEAIRVLDVQRNHARQLKSDEQTAYYQGILLGLNLILNPIGKDADEFAYMLDNFSSDPFRN